MDTTPPSPTTEQASVTPGTHPIIVLDGVTKSFGGTRHSESVAVLDKMQLTIPAKPGGQIIVFLGPSGCGKSTILNMLSGLLLPDSGTVHTFGDEVTGPNPHCATVPQAYTCFPWLTALGNVQFGLALEGKSREEQRTIATSYLEKVGLGKRLNAYPRQLSGGMQQRVAIARTLALKLPLVLMDEPFGALDAQTRLGMQQTLLQLWAEEQNTILFVTHDINEALLIADRIILFSTAPAQIVIDMQVDFLRPRPMSLMTDSHFIKTSQYLFQRLRETEVHGAQPAANAPAQGIDLPTGEVEGSANDAGTPAART